MLTDILRQISLAAHCSRHPAAPNRFIRLRLDRTVQNALDSTDHIYWLHGGGIDFLLREWLNRFTLDFKF